MWIMFEKGDRVIVKASVYTKDKVSAQIRPCEFPHETVVDVETKWGGVARPLRRMVYKESFEGIVVGWAIRKTGEHRYGSGYDDPGCLFQEKNHKVIMVQPMDTQRWVKPIPCLEEDLEKKR
jgi:hypothetical protein